MLLGPVPIQILKAASVMLHSPKNVSSSIVMENLARSHHSKSLCLGSLWRLHSPTAVSMGQKKQSLRRVARLANVCLHAKRAALPSLKSALQDLPTLSH